MNKIQISVVIPTYNRENLLRRAIQSVLNQTLAPAEIVVVDDGSIDGSAAMVAQEFPSVKYVRQSNSGVSAARNRGIVESSGDWIAFLDSDDEWAPKKLELQAQLIRSNRELRWLSGKNAIHCQEHENLEGAPREGHVGIPSPRGNIISFFEPLSNTRKCHTSATVVAKSVFEELGMFKVGLSFGEHHEMWFRIAFSYPELGYVEDVCVVKHPGSEHSLSANQDRSQMVQLFETLGKEAEVVPRELQQKIHRWMTITASVQVFKQICIHGSAQELPEELTRFVPGRWKIAAKCLQILPKGVRTMSARKISSMIRRSI